MEFVIFIGLALAVFFYVLGAFIMFITGNGWMAFTWPYHLLLLMVKERNRT